LNDVSLLAEIHRYGSLPLSPSTPTPDGMARASLTFKNGTAIKEHKTKRTIIFLATVTLP
jgi:hypothetical protein